jgi:hypothetical protein
MEVRMPAPTFPITIDLGELPSAKADARALRAAAAAVRRLPMYVSPHVAPSKNEHDVYTVVAHLAMKLYRSEIQQADAELDTYDQLFQRHLSANPSISNFPSDAAVNRWTPEINAAYFLGIVMGARLARLADAGGVQ